MIFSLIRWIFVIIIFIICYIFIKKSNIVNKRKWIILSIFIALFLPFLTTLGPIENAFITFSSLESAYYYSNEGYIEHIVEGNETDFVIAQKDDSNILTIIPKTNDGWKIATGLNIKRIVSTNSGIATICVYQYKNSDDYYIVVYSLKEGELVITDNRNSRFDCLEGNNSNKSYYKYCSYIHCFDEDYVITVDGKPISFNNNKNSLN